MEKNTTKLDLDYYERVIAYNCIFDSTYLGTIIDYLSEDLFSDKDVKSTIHIIKDFYVRRNEVPTINEIRAYLDDPKLKESFKNLLLKIQEFENTVFNKDELVENTETFLKQKSVFNTLLTAAQNHDNGKLDAGDLLLKMEQAVGINLSSSIGLDLLDDTDHFISELSKNETKISTGWKWLDNKISGGFLEQGKALYIFIGETNVGKSIFLGNIAANVAMQGKTALVISLEMSEVMYGMRFASKLTKIPMFELKSDVNNLKEQLDDIKRKNKKSKILIKEFPPSTISPFQVGAYLKKLQQKGIKVDCLVLDYLNLLNSPSSTNMYEKVKNISEQLRAISYTYKMPIISASQITRCLDVNTLVDCLGGSKKKIGDIRKDDYIMGSKGYVSVKHVYPREIQKCYKIKTKTGKEIVCSSKHLFPIGVKECKSIDSGLRVGDKLLIKKMV